ncbi:hypothetical protein [Cobetia marina]|uniref:hypothetical protein n=1 Tax=Cobetia marina TaxID=28258 RepID=UPI003A940CDD
MITPKYFVNDLTRICRVVAGPGTAEEAIADGFREVTEPQQEEFRAVTKVALDAGWNPDAIGYAKFMAKHPHLIQNDAVEA